MEAKGTTRKYVTYKSTNAYATSLVASTSPKTVVSIQGHHKTGVGDQFLQIFDAASLPADAAVPIQTIRVPENDNFSIDFVGGRVFETGVVIVGSTTAATKTLSAANWYIIVDMI